MKKAYTLIELIIVMAIMSILILSTVKLSSSYKHNVNRIKAKGFVNELSNIISFGKHYCRHYDSYGLIEINKTKGQVKFKDISLKSKVIKSITLPDGFKFTTTSSLNINTTGHIDSDTVRIIDEKGILYKLTISTGVDTVNIYEGE